MQKKGGKIYELANVMHFPLNFSPLFILTIMPAKYSISEMKCMEGTAEKLCHIFLSWAVQCSINPLVSHTTMEYYYYFVAFRNNSFFAKWK